MQNHGEPGIYRCLIDLRCDDRVLISEEQDVRAALAKYMDSTFGASPFHGLIYLFGSEYWDM